MIVRAALADDARAIAEVRVAAWRAAYREIMPPGYLASLDSRQGIEGLVRAIQSPQSLFRLKVAVAAGVVVGFVIVGMPRYQARPETLELRALNIHPDHWRPGVARLLVQEALEDTKAQRYARLELWCLAGNAPARRLYESSGFVLTEESRTTSALTGHPLHEVAYSTVPDLVVRPVEARDDLVALTDLVHAAYATHAASGLMFWGTHQSVADTARRLASGQGFLALADGELVGTITVRPPQESSPVPLYCLPDIWSFCQFAVHPGWKGRGVGTALHERALRHAAAHGARRVALDTASPAAGLIRMYRSWGYEECGHCDWRPNTNYLSTLMVRPIDAL